MICILEILSDVFENFRKMCLEIYKLDLVKFISAPELAWLAALKKSQVELNLTTDIDMLLKRVAIMTEKGIRGGICNTTHHYAKANNKYMRDYDKNRELSYFNYCDVNDLYGWEMSQKLPTFNFELVEDSSQFNEDFVKNYDEKDEVGCILEVDVKYPKELYEPHSDLPFLQERKKFGKVDKLVTSLAVFGKTMENVRNYKDIKLVTTKRRRNYLVCKPNCYSTKFFTKKLLAIEMKKAQITISKPVSLGLLILDLGKTTMCKFWHDYIKAKYSEKA